MTRDYLQANRRLQQLELDVVRRLDGLLQGDFRGLVAGAGTEPAESRLYNVGDDLRRMDWRLTARTMQLHPAVAFGCAIAGASISGIVGAFLALPLAAIVQALGSTYIHRHDVEETDLTRVATSGEAKGIREERKRQGRGWLARRSGKDDDGTS